MRKIKQISILILVSAFLSNILTVKCYTQDLSTSYMGYYIPSGSKAFQGFYSDNFDMKGESNNNDYYINGTVINLKMLKRPFDEDIKIFIHLQNKSIIKESLPGNYSEKIIVTPFKISDVKSNLNERFYNDLIERSKNNNFYTLTIPKSIIEDNSNYISFSLTIDTDGNENTLNDLVEYKFNTNFEIISLQDSVRMGVIYHPELDYSILESYDKTIFLFSEPENVEGIHIDKVISSDENIIQIGKVLNENKRRGSFGQITVKGVSEGSATITAFLSCNGEKATISKKYSVYKDLEPHVIVYPFYNYHSIAQLESQIKESVYIKDVNSDLASDFVSLDNFSVNITAPWLDDTLYYAPISIKAHNSNDNVLLFYSDKPNLDYSLKQKAILKADGESIITIIYTFLGKEYQKKYTVRVVNLVEQELYVVFDGRQIFSENSPVIKNDMAFIPIQMLEKKLDLDINWDSKLRKVTIYNHDKGYIELFIDSKKGFLNGTEIEMNSPVQIINGQTMVPIQFFSDFLNHTVKLDNNLKTVFID